MTKKKRFRIGIAGATGAVGRTSTYALCNFTLPWALELANRGMPKAAEDLEPVAWAVNTCDGEITNKAVAETFDMPYNPRFGV